MKNINLYGMPDHAMSARTDALPGYVPEQEGPENQSYEQLQYALSELAALKQALARSQQQLKTAQLHIDSLEATKTSLREKLIRLAKKCAQALHFAYHDELTGLPNRTLLLDRLKQAMAQSDRKQKQVALLFIDLDKFKSINDRLGHSAGDTLLQLVAERLSACIRKGDTACRYGGDEFLVMLPEIDGQDNAALVTEKIRARLAAPYVLDGYSISITASIGIALYRADGLNCSELIKQADTAMYHAKKRSNLPSGPVHVSIQN